MFDNYELVGLVMTGFSTIYVDKAAAEQMCSPGRSAELLGNVEQAAFFVGRYRHIYRIVLLKEQGGGMKDTVRRLFHAKMLGVGLIIASKDDNIRIPNYACAMYYTMLRMYGAFCAVGVQCEQRIKRMDDTDRDGCERVASAHFVCRCIDLLAVWGAGIVGAKGNQYTQKKTWS